MDVGQDEMREIMEEFFTEAGEGLDDLEQDLIKLESMAESGATDADTVDRIFRTLHTLKGGAGFLGLEQMAGLGHAGENLLDDIRQGKVAVNKDVMDALLKTNDTLKELLDISRIGEDPASVDISPLVRSLEVLSGRAPSAPQVLTESPVDVSASAPVEAQPEPQVEAPTMPQDPLATPMAPAAESSVFGRPEPEVPHGATAPVVTDINSELIAEIEADPRLEASLDKGEDDLPQAPARAGLAPEAPVEELAPVEAAPVVENSVFGRPEPEAPHGATAPVVTGINSELIAEIEADPRLEASLDSGEDDLPQAPARAGLAPEVPVEEAAPESELEISGPQFITEPEQPQEMVSDAPVFVEEPEMAVDVESEEEESEPEVQNEELVLPRGNAKPVERRESGDDGRRAAQERRVQGRRTGDVETTIRVETGRLDAVMNLVGELVLARNSLVQQLNQQQVKTMLSKSDRGNQITANIEHLSRVTQDLQMSVLSTRMQPIKKVFDKIPRQVRELKNRLGREVDLIIEGEMTEVDKTLVEELADPMVHLIRNALDHGIESPEDRRASGKSPVGSLAVRAFYEGNNVVIQVAEDGKGIDADKIRKAAISKGMIDESAARQLSDEEAVRLILKPGFSTAENVSDVSGRGVGMDVVNTKISAIKGTVDIQTEKGMGTTISIYLPLTLAIMQALLIEGGGEGFAIPIGDISEVIKFRPEDVHKMNEKDVIELRGEALPLFYIHSLTKNGIIPRIDPASLSEHSAALVAQAEVRKASEAPVSAEASIAKAMRDNSHGKGYIIVVREGAQSLGVVIDDLIGQEEAVVKPVTEMFEYNKAISGATITGDGTVHMILDIPYLMKNNARR